MSAAHAILCKWDGENFRPVRQHAAIADKRFVVGEKYALAVEEERSAAAHRHYFANLKQAWENLPENISPEFPTSEHLRARGLIECGFADEYRFVGATSRDATTAAAAAARGNEFAVVAVNDRAAVVRIPKSQAVRHMNKADFTRSSNAVLEWAWGLCGLKPDYAKKNAGEAA